MLRLISSACSFLVIAGVASAHPGHGSAAVQDGMLHYLLSPVHAGPAVTVAILVIAALGFMVYRRNRIDR